MAVIVIGGGLGGLAAAIAAQRAARDVVVLEQAGGPNEVETGITLWPFAVAALAELGLDDAAISRIGAPLERIVNLTPDGQPLSEIPIEPLPGGVKAYDVDRAKLQAELITALGPAAVRYGARCVGVAATQRGASAALDGGETEGEVVIGADGVHSVVRRHLAPEVTAKSPDVGVWRGTLELGESVVPSGVHFRIYGAAGVFGVARLDARRVRFYAGGRIRQGEEPGRRALEARFAHWCEPAATVISSSVDKELLVNDTPRIPPLSRWVRGRVALLGDAAHATVPTLGASGGLALADAVALGRALAEATDDKRALASYAREREPIGRRVQREAETFGLLELSPRSRLNRLQRRLLAPPFVSLQRRAIAHVAHGAERSALADMLYPPRP